MNQLDMQGRGAIVTGGAAGIGYAIAQRLAASGARVSLWDRDASALQAAAKSLGANTHTHVLDVTSEDEWQARAKPVSRHLAASTLWSAAPASRGRIPLCSSTRWRRGKKYSRSTSLEFSCATGR